MKENPWTPETIEQAIERVENQIKELQEELENLKSKRRRRVIKSCSREYHPACS